MVHESKYVKFIYQENESDYLVVTFNPIIMGPNDKHFWGDEFLRKKGISALGFVTTDRNWFPRESMEELCEEARPIFKRYRSICLYGFSMGAYGAIKYSRLIGAQTVVAFSPQHTIDPGHEHASRSYTRFFNEAIHRDVTIKSTDMAGDIFIFYDPFHMGDYHAVEHIAAQGPIHRIRVPFVGHTSVVPFTEARKGMDVLQLCRAGDLTPLYRLSREVRKGHRPRLATLTFALLARHPGWALSLCRKYPEILYGLRLEKFSRRLKLAGHLDRAIVWAQEAVAREPANPEPIRQLAMFLHEAGRLSEAKEACQSALLLDPRDYRLLLRLCQICQAGSEYDEAARWSKQAVEMRPQDPAVFIQWIDLLRKRGRRGEIAAAVEKALKYHAQNPKLKALFEELSPRQLA